MGYSSNPSFRIPVTHSPRAQPSSRSAHLYNRVLAMEQKRNGTPPDVMCQILVQISHLRHRSEHPGNMRYEGPPRPYQACGLPAGFCHRRSRGECTAKAADWRMSPPFPSIRWASNENMIHIHMGEIKYTYVNTWPAQGCGVLN